MTSLREGGNSTLSALARTAYRVKRYIAVKDVVVDDYLPSSLVAFHGLAKAAGAVRCESIHKPAQLRRKHHDNPCG